MRKALLFIATAMLSFTMFAQNISNTAGINKLSLEVRTDFDHYNWKGTSDQNSGFYGRYLNFNISGDIIVQPTAFAFNFKFSVIILNKKIVINISLPYFNYIIPVHIDT